MKVLAFFHTYPWPALSGDAVRNSALVQLLLEQGVEVHVATLGRDGPEPLDPPPAGVTASIVGRSLGHYLRSVPNKVLMIMGRPCQFAVGSNRSVRSTLRNLWVTGEFDSALVGTSYCLSAMPVESYRNIVFDTHNVEFERLESIFARASGPRKIAGRRIVDKCREFERACLQTVPVTLVCSEREVEEFASLNPRCRIEVLPNGSDACSVPPEVGNDAPILFLASLDYSANVDSLSYLLQEIAPALPETQRIWVAGSRPNAEALELIKRSGSTIEYLGQVADANAVMRSALALIVPLRQGSGTRLKILQAWSAGVPVISTSKGAEGLNARDNINLLIADDVAEFVSAVNRLKVDPNLRHRLIEQSQQLINSTYAWSRSGSQLKAALEGVSGV